MPTVRASDSLAMPAAGLSGSRVRFRAAHIADDTASVTPPMSRLSRSTVHVWMGTLMTPPMGTLMTPPNMRDFRSDGLVWLRFYESPRQGERSLRGVL